MAQTIVTSGKFSLNSSDLLRGLLIAVVSPVITIIIDTLNAGSLTFNWKTIIITGLSAGLAYLAKNFFTPSEIVVQDAPQSLVNAAKAGNVEVVKTAN